MASAVLPSRNEPHWNERKIYMRNYTSANPTHSQLNSRFNPNPNPNPSPNFNVTRQQVQNVSGLSHLRQGNVPSTLVPMANTNAVDNRNDSFHREYVTFNLGSYSRKELKDLKARLVSDLGRVRGLLNRIGARDFDSRTPYQARNVVQPPPAPQLQLNQPALVQKPVGGKNKKLSGHKRALGLASGKNPKRGPVVEGDKFFVSVMRKCRQILTKLMKHKHGWVFNTPVDVKGLKLYDYYNIIKRPMDLGTVKLRLDGNEYRTPEDFAADVRLTFNNAMIYNPRGQDVHHMAEMLLCDFEVKFKPVHKKYEAEQQKVAATKQRNLSQPAVTTPPKVFPVANELDSVPVHSNLLNQREFQAQRLSPQPVFTTPAVRSFPPQPVITPRSAKLPKPKAKDPNKREMTCDEKHKLGENLQILPIEKMEHMVQIVKRKNPNLTQEGDEIELDLEVLDNETLWELDRFITYHKKAMNKMKKQGVTEDAGQLNKSPEKAPTPEHDMQKNMKGGDVGEEDVDIGEDIPIENFPPVEIEKDVPCVSSGSSSSSSSSSGSDSSSSDSGSSSGSDSDEDSVQSPFVEAKEAPAT